MNGNESVLESNRNFIGCERFVMHPEFHIVNEHLQFNRYLVPRATYIGFMRAKYSSPTPNLSEHLAVDRTDKIHRQNVPYWRGAKPQYGIVNIRLLEFIELALCGNRLNANTPELFRFDGRLTRLVVQR